MQRSNCVYACLQGNRVLTRSYEHLVGAYGVVGFSGVKDARKSVLIADALASADWPAGSVHSQCNWCAFGMRSLDKHWTKTGRLLDKDWTFAGLLTRDADA